MNYFAHAMHFLDQPYFAAGTAVPDWLTVVDRGVRVRWQRLRPFLHDPDPCAVSVAGGIWQHIRDDKRFHDSRAFVEVSLRLTAIARDALGGESGMRPGFLGHLLVEVLLDASLVAESPDRLEAYYRALRSVDAQRVQQTVSRMTNRPPNRLAMMIAEFRRKRILSDYREDDKLMKRLNQVMCRVRRPQLPDDFRHLLPEARRLVDGRKSDLLEGIPSES